MSDKTLTRIAALLRKAESTDNEHEADAFFSAAQRLATAAAIDLAVARAHGARRAGPTGPTQREVLIGQAGKRGLRTYVELFVAIARANDVTCDVASNSTRVFAYGYASDLDTVAALYAALVVQMVRASDEFLTSKRHTAETVRRYSRTRHRWETRPVSGITARLGFQRAFAARIGARLAEARASTQETAIQAARTDPGGESGVALALRAKEVAVTDYYRTHSTARGRWRGSAESAAPSAAAARAGDRAGRSARLGTETALGGSRRALPPA